MSIEEKLTDKEKTQIRQIIESPQWETIKRAADLLIRKIQNKSVVSDSEWETIRNTVSKEARVQGIREFIQELFSQTK